MKVRTDEVNSKLNEHELVSIIMPAYNCEEFISETIESVINQTYKNWELIVIDDCSTDNTKEKILEMLKQDKRIFYKCLKENSGAAIARNTAVNLAKGKYIAFLDSDDLWRNEKLHKQLNFMKENNYYFSSTNYNKIDEDGNDLDRVVTTPFKRDYNYLLKSCPGNSTVIYNAEKLGKFNIPNIKKRNDYVMWLSVIKESKWLYGLNETLSSHRIRQGAISSNKKSLVGYHWKVYRDIENLSIIKSCYLVLYWIFATVFKLR
ncbi:glycosyltransferase family 2 protein [Rossellomorea marisflavi]